MRIFTPRQAVEYLRDEKKLTMYKINKSLKLNPSCGVYHWLRKDNVNVSIQSAYLLYKKHDILLTDFNDLQHLLSLARSSLPNFNEL